MFCVCVFGFDPLKGHEDGGQVCFSLSGFDPVKGHEGEGKVFFVCVWVRSPEGA